MSYEILQKANGWSKTFPNKEELTAFLQEQPERVDAWEGHEMLALDIEPAPAPALTTAHIEALTTAQLGALEADDLQESQDADPENTPVQRPPKEEAQEPAVKLIPQKTVVHQSKKGRN